MQKTVEKNSNEVNKTAVEDLYKFSSSEIKPRSFNEIVVILTVEDYPAMIFRMSRQLSDELKAAREIFFGLSDDEQKLQQSGFRIGQISQLLLECPENVPGVENDADWKESLAEFFKQNPDFVNWVWGQYQTKQYPKELLLRLSD